MNPAHRDRIAFVRIVSGAFERGMTVTVPRIARTFKLTQTTQFLADDSGNCGRSSCWGYYWAS